MFEFRYLLDAPLLSVDEFPELGGNINGPSLVAAPDWLENAPAKYLLFFAHHEGQSIRLACSDALTGPWRLHKPDPLTLAQSRFATRRPSESELCDEARAFIADDADGDYPHIASPDVWVDHRHQEIRLYYHGRLQDGRQRTRVAVSHNGVRFEARDDILSESYLRVFKRGNWFYGISMPARLCRSSDGLTPFEYGPRLTQESIRHHAWLEWQGRAYLLWTRVGDQPESILLSRVETGGDWRHWRLAETRLLHQAQRPWEGSELPALASRYGAVHQPANQLRDPAVFVENGKVYLLYSVMGERGIGIGELAPL